MSLVVAGHAVFHRLALTAVKREFVVADFAVIGVRDILRHTRACATVWHEVEHRIERCHRSPGPGGAAQTDFHADTMRQAGLPWHRDRCRHIRDVGAERVAVLAVAELLERSTAVSIRTRCLRQHLRSVGLIRWRRRDEIALPVGESAIHRRVGGHHELDERERDAARGEPERRIAMCIEDRKVDDGRAVDRHRRNFGLQLAERLDLLGRQRAAVADGDRSSRRRPRRSLGSLRTGRTRGSGGSLRTIVAFTSAEAEDQKSCQQ